MSKRSLLSVFLVIGAFVLLASCGSSDDTNTNTGTGSVTVSGAGN